MSAFAKLPLPETYLHRGLPITILRMGDFEDRLRVFVSAPCPLSNPYDFVNPPLCVWREGVPVEDPAAALREMVGEAVYAVARRRGWGPEAPWRR